MPYLLLMELLDEQAVHALQTFFNTAPLPDRVALDAGTTVIDVPLFLKTQFNVLQSTNSQAVRRPAFDRLVRLRAVLTGKDQK